MKITELLVLLDADEHADAYAAIWYDYSYAICGRGAIIRAYMDFVRELCDSSS